MKVLFIGNTDIKGGAPIASYRLFKALEKNTAIEIDFLVQNKFSDESKIYSTKSKRWMNYLRFVWERFVFLFHEKSSRERFKFSLANTGENVTNNKLFKQADIIHIHWFNQGFLSLSDFEKILNSRKPVIWTLHDLWAFTGGCHYPDNCKNFQKQCGDCPLLKRPSKNDLSTKIYKKKQRLYSNYKNLSFITCSSWLKEMALKSSLISDFSIHTIHHTLNLDTFRPKNKEEIKQKLNFKHNKQYILFGADNISDTRKGLSYLIKAFEYLNKNYNNTQNIELLVFGRMKENVLESLPFKVNYFSYLSDTESIVDLYNIADVFVGPSLEEAFGQTFLESMACGTPCVAFNYSGPRDIIEHKKTGYLAKYKSVEDLSNGIGWILFESDHKTLSNLSRQKVLNDFNQEKIASLHKELYEKVLENSKHAE